MNSQKEIKIFLLDDLNYEVLGYIKLFANDLVPNIIEEKNEYLLRENGVKTRSKLIYTTSLIPSKVRTKLITF